MHLPLEALPPRPAPDPLDVLAALAEAHPDSEIALLHSAPNATFSVLATNPFLTLEVDAAAAAHLSTISGLALPPPLHPLEALGLTVKDISFDAPHPLVGWLGFIAYDLAFTLEEIGRPHRDATPAWPLLRFSLYRHYLLFDHITKTCTPLAFDGEPSLAAALLETAGAGARGGVQALFSAATLREATPRAAYVERIRAVQGHIAAGDIYQANLAQRWTFSTQASPHAIYRRLCERSPAHYAAYLQFRDHAGISRHVLSASPELFLNMREGQVLTRPIKGTRPRDRADRVHDAALADELLASEKDRAELAMIVDLLRNDLGRVAAYRSVQVRDPRALEAHPTVWHTAATIEAALRPEAALADVLRALLPGGSITGVPKIRACQIINGLEDFPRALYCGNVGVLGSGGRLALLNIAIRTLLLTGSTVHAYAGGGIVADSSPEAEYEETLHKAAALVDALGAGAAFNRL